MFNKWITYEQALQYTSYVHKNVSDMNILLHCELTGFVWLYFAGHPFQVFWQFFHFSVEQPIHNWLLDN